MKPDEFAYWLQGFFEVSEAETLTPKQVCTVKKHLALVFKHLDGPDPTGELGKIHHGSGGAPRPDGTVYRC